MGFRFRSFPLYEEIRIFVREIYELSRAFPKSEQFELISQIRKAAYSIMLNIAEGSAKKSDAEFNRFVLIALGSIAEVVAILDICLDQNYISIKTHQEYLEKCEILAKKLYGFSRQLAKGK